MNDETLGKCVCRLTRYSHLNLVNTLESLELNVFEDFQDFFLWFSRIGMVFTRYAYQKRNKQSICKIFKCGISKASHTKEILKYFELYKDLIRWWFMWEAWYLSSKMLGRKKRFLGLTFQRMLKHVIIRIKEVWWSPLSWLTSLWLSLRVPAMSYLCVSTALTIWPLAQAEFLHRRACTHQSPVHAEINQDINITYSFASFYPSILICCSRKYWIRIIKKPIPM